MALKLLTRKDAPLEHEEAGIRIRLGRLLPEHIAEMKGLLTSSHKPGVTLAIYALRECISEISVRGEEELNPRQLSYQLDTNDPDNEAFLTVVSAMLIEELLVSEEARKKLKARRAPTGETSDA